MGDTKLPVRALPTAVVDLGDGVTITVHGLSRAAALHCSQGFNNEAGEMTDPAGLEVYMVAQATDVTEDVAREWYETVPMADGQKVIEQIMALSGLNGKNGTNPQ